MAGGRVGAGGTRGRFGRGGGVANVLVNVESGAGCGCCCMLVEDGVDGLVFCVRLKYNHNRIEVNKRGPLNLLWRGENQVGRHPFRLKHFPTDALNRTSVSLSPHIRMAAFLKSSGSDSSSLRQ